METELVITGDGSHTLYLPELDEHFHSIHGAVQESMHVFTENGLRYLAPNAETVDILEIGFGTGLNCLLSIIESKYSGKYIKYTGLEVNILDNNTVNILNYPSFTDDPGASGLLRSIHHSAWGEPVQLSPEFTLLKIEADALSVHLDQQYDLVYFDAFAPRVQPELWSESMFKKMFGVLKPEGILVTYCAKGEVKRRLKAAGFLVESLPGPPGKREMTRAVKSL